MTGKSSTIGRLYALATILATLGLLGGRASAAEHKPTKEEREVEYRHSLYHVIAGNFGPIQAMADGKMPWDVAQAAVRAERVAFLAPMLKEAFPPESNGVAHTDAKPEIWPQPQQFAAALQALIDKSATLALVAKGGDTAKIKVAANDTAKTCKDCHDKFRVDDEH